MFNRKERENENVIDAETSGRIRVFQLDDHCKCSLCPFRTESTHANRPRVYCNIVAKQGVMPISALWRDGQKQTRLDQGRERERERISTIDCSVRTQMAW